VGITLSHVEVRSEVSEVNPVDEVDRRVKESLCANHAQPREGLSVR
jgi:hypothetical protein